MVFIPLSSELHLRLDMLSDRQTKPLLLAYLRDISPVSGVYLYLSKENTPLYVGRSRNIYTRLLQQATPQGIEPKMTDDWQKIGIIVTKHPILTEKELIRRYKPIFNNT